MAQFSFLLFIIHLIMHMARGVTATACLSTVFCISFESHAVVCENVKFGPSVKWNKFSISSFPTCSLPHYLAIFIFAFIWIFLLHFALQIFRCHFYIISIFYSFWSTWVRKRNKFIKNLKSLCEIILRLRKFSNFENLVNFH